MPKKKFELRRIKDKGDKFTIKKTPLFDIPFRLVICGQSGSGKTSALVSLLTDNIFYKKNFKPENIFLFSPMVNDYKLEYMVKTLKIPDLNIFTELDNNLLSELYDRLCDEYEQEIATDGTVSPKLIIMDDLSYDGSLRKGGHQNMVNKIFCNGRKHQISIAILQQHYVHCSPVCRTNASGMMIFNTNDKQLDMVAEENNYLDSKKEFKKMFRDNVKERHDAIVINYSNSRKEGIYLNKNFEKIG
jgi:hypothetical protein